MNHPIDPPQDGADDYAAAASRNHSEAGEPPPARPSFIPEKFWDPRSGQVRVDDLAKSYRALERKMGAGAHLPNQPDRHDPADEEREDFDDLDDMDGLEDLDGPDGYDHLPAFDPDDPLADFDPDETPDRPEDYLVDPGHPWLEVDPEVMSVLHEAGFSHEQAQLVYDLAATHVMPALEQMLAQTHRLRDEQQLSAYFGSNTRYEEAARQIADWGSANLPPEVYAGLSAHPNGVIAMFRLMQSDEPRFLGSAAPPGRLAEGDLKKLILDPKYWRDHDPATVRRVEEGFRRLYPDGD